MDFVKVDFQEVFKEITEAFERASGIKLHPAQIERLILQVFAYRENVLRVAINESAKQNLLKFAKAENLDALAEFYGVERLSAKPAITTLRFEFVQRNEYVTIPEGTRVATPDGKVIFKTIKTVDVSPSESYVDVPAECEKPGTFANGYAPGEINTLLDSVPYVSQVYNITMSMYGTDEEDDERFRERIRLSLERFTNAGSKEAYIYHTKTVHQDIEDVSVFSPQPGVVKVVFLLKNGQLPDAQMIELVRKHLSDEKVRPLTDQVIVSAPQVVNYDISLTYYIHRKDEALVSQIQEKVNKAVQDFIDWTKSKIGRDVLPEELIRRVKEAGAYRVSLTAPNYIPIAQDQVAQAQSVSINYGGLVDD